MRRSFSFVSFTHTHRGNLLMGFAAIFALGLTAGTMLRPSPQSAAPVAAAHAAVTADNPTRTDTPIAHRLDPSIVYPAEVVRGLDRDPLPADVRVWPGLDVDTKIRLRGVDAAELHARC